MLIAPKVTKETPILFKPELVRAILSGTKRQTRRIVSFSAFDSRPNFPNWALGNLTKYQVGDTLWVREQMEVTGYTSNEEGTFITVKYCADGTSSGSLPYPSRLKGKPVVGKKLAYGGYREASRLTLKITDVRVERVADMSEEDAIAEGIESQYCKVLRSVAYRDYSFKPTKFVKEDWLKCPIQSFRTLWNSINKPRGYGWETNPWVWVIEFELVRR